MAHSSAYYDTMDSPVGRLFVGGTDAGLSHVEFMKSDDDLTKYLGRLEVEAGGPATRGGAGSVEVLRQLREYFAGERWQFDLRLAPEGTAWQQQVWFALRSIPVGETVSYGTIAARLGRPTASRAVGAANGRNPISIVVPCHRVIGADRALTGYGGGMERKQWLLAHEGVTFDLDSSAAIEASRAVALVG